MEVEELKIQLKQQIQQYKKAKETYELLARKVAILKKIKITTEEAAILLGVKPRTIRKYHEDQKLMGFKYTREGRIYFLADEVEAYQKEHLKNWDALD